jgi:hypothetical protein
MAVHGAPATQGMAGGRVAPAAPRLTVRLSGQAVVGKTLKAVVKVGGKTVKASSYRWSRGGSLVKAATGGTYKLGPSDFKKHIAVSVTAKAGAATLAKAAHTASAVSAGKMTVSSLKTTGEPRVGAKLTVYKGKVKLVGATGGARTSYQWLRDGKKISNAETYYWYAGDVDVGHVLSVRVTTRAHGYKTVVQIGGSWKVDYRDPVVPPESHRVKQ